MSRVARKSLFRVSEQDSHKPDSTSKEIARGLKFRIQEEEIVYYLCSENKDADQLYDHAADLRGFFRI